MLEKSLLILLRTLSFTFIWPHLYTIPLLVIFSIFLNYSKLHHQTYSLSVPIYLCDLNDFLSANHTTNRIVWICINFLTSICFVPIYLSNCLYLYSHYKNNSIAECPPFVVGLLAHSLTRSLARSLLQMRLSIDVVLFVCLLLFCKSIDLHTKNS